jgi:mannose-1-phosphate guanylyltransferase/phosphomannomutase
MPRRTTSALHKSDHLVSYHSPGDERAEEEQLGAIVLAGVHRGGRSPFERLRSPLLPVAATPLICYPLRWLRESGLRSATICANGSAREIRAYLGRGSRVGMELAYYEDWSPRGPAGCVRDAGQIGSAGTFIVIEGTVIPTVQLTDVLAVHRREGAAVTAVVDVDDRPHPISGERARTASGIYVFERHTFEYIPKVGYHDIKEGLLERLYRAGERVAVHEVHGSSPRVLDYPSYTAVNRWVVERAAQQPELLEGYVVEGDVLRHPTARLDPSARFMGPVVVGPGAQVMAGALVVGPSTIGAECRIGARAAVSRSVLWKRCVIGADAVVDDCLLADNAVVEPSGQLFGVLKLPVPGTQELDRTPVGSAEARTHGDAVGVTLAAS